MTKKFIMLCGLYRCFSSLSFYHGLDMVLATRDALVINGSYLGFFTSSFDHGAVLPFSIAILDSLITLNIFLQRVLHYRHRGSEVTSVKLSFGKSLKAQCQRHWVVRGTTCPRAETYFHKEMESLWKIYENKSSNSVSPINTSHIS